MTQKNFNIKQTVNRNIEKNQFPYFANHRSMVGWCTMNYPKVLQNPIYLQKDVIPQQKKYELNSLFQQKNPQQRQKKQFIKPFSQPIEPQENNDTQQIVGNIYSSSLTLATTKYEDRAKIFKGNNAITEKYSSVKPLELIIGENRDNNFDRKIRQIGQIYYEPANQSEQMRHLKKLPNTIINEDNLIEIINDKLEYLDLQYKNDISNELINKLGYLSPKIKQLILIAVPIDNEVLIQLGKSCKFLQSIDISLCSGLQQNAICTFLKDRFETIKKFKANHNIASVSDVVLQCLGKCQHLYVLYLNYCTKITAGGIQMICQKSFEELALASLVEFKIENIVSLINNSINKLKYLDLSFNMSKDIGNLLMKSIGMCTKLQTLLLNGCQNITDEGVNNLIYGEKGKKNQEGFPLLRVLKMGGLINISDNVYQLLKRCQSITFFQGNNLERLTDHFLDQVKNHTSLRTLFINFTPNISEQRLKQVKESNKNLNIIRNILKMTDPADDGLRMPIPPASMKVKKPKKKKK